MSRSTQDFEKAELIKSVMLQTKAEYYPTKYQESPPGGWKTQPVDCDEVYPNLFIGDRNSALNKKFLQFNGITHVVNTAEGSGIGMVNTGPEFYRGVGIHYLGLPLSDLSATNVLVHFETVANFIDNALKRNGRVLVHCYMGMSRSAILTLAYLVLKKNMSACRAMACVRKRRNIHPNDGFIHQLAVLDNKISRRQILSVF